MTRKALLEWPPVRTVEEGAREFSMRCLSMERWYWTHQVCRWLLRILGAAGMMAASVTLWSDGLSVAHLEGWHAEFAWVIRKWAQDQWLLDLPVSVEAFDWVLFIVGALLFGTAHRVGNLIAELVLFCMSRFLAKRITITITPEVLAVNRGRRDDLTLVRGDIGDGQVQVRLVSLEDYFSRISSTELVKRQFLTRDLRVPPAIVEIVQGLSRHKIIAARRKDEAEAIVVRCNEALLATS